MSAGPTWATVTGRSTVEDWVAALLSSRWGAAGGDDFDQEGLCAAVREVVNDNLHLAGRSKGTTRHAGIVTVGRVSHDVELTESGDHAGNEPGLDDSLDEAYRTKYGRSSSAVEHITAEPARATTLRVDPV